MLLIEIGAERQFGRMKKLDLLKAQCKNREMDYRFAKLYGKDAVEEQRKRYFYTLEQYEILFGPGEAELYSAPGRTEIGGNHTDHQHGMVLAASVNLDTIAVVGLSDKNTIELVSEGYAPLSISLDNLEEDCSEYGTTAALIKGVASGFLKRGHRVGGFKAYMTSNVLNGAGLSSSAAFETVVGTILSGLFNDGKISPVEIAIIGQYAENIYFGKPCGLMDQMACSVGSIVQIDFKDVSNPVVEKIDFDLTGQGYSMCIVDTKGSHADLTEDYAAIPREMKAVAGIFGKEVLREVSREEFQKRLPEIFEKVGGRAVLRTIHFFTENERVQEQAKALREKNFEKFLQLVKASGNSSYKYLQNIYTNHDVNNQPISVALALSETILGDNGVCRVHGGGFAGTIQAFVRNEAVIGYKNEMERIFGEGACHVLKVRKYGGVKVL